VCVKVCEKERKTQKERKRIREERGKRKLDPR
jgi:hypothetical protein